MRRWKCWLRWGSPHLRQAQCHDGRSLLGTSSAASLAQSPSVIVAAVPPISEWRRHATATRTGRGAGSCAASLGLWVLARWVLNVPFLKGPFPGLVSANTAIGLLALGVATLLTTFRPSPVRRRTARLLAGLAIMIGALTLVEYLLGRNLAIDQLILRDLSALPSVHPGRPAPQTAITFISLGWALQLLQGKKTRSRLVGALTGGSFVLTISAVIGYAFGVPGLDGDSGIAPVALLTAVAFLFLCAGISASDPDGVFVEVLTSDGPGSVVARRLLPGRPGASFLRMAAAQRTARSCAARAHRGSDRELHGGRSIGSPSDQHSFHDHRCVRKTCRTPRRADQHWGRDRHVCRQALFTQ